jgi:hypothetical protein
VVWARPGGDRGRSPGSDGGVLLDTDESSVGGRSAPPRGLDVGELRLVKLYEAMEYLEKSLDDKAWLVRRYRRTLQGDIRNGREEQKKREKLRVTARAVALACAEKIVAEMNELAARYRENKRKIDWLRRVLELVRRPVRTVLSPALDD